MSDEHRKLADKFFNRKWESKEHDILQIECDGCGCSGFDANEGASYSIVVSDKTGQRYRPVGWFCPRCKNREWAWQNHRYPDELYTKNEILAAIGLEGKRIDSRTDYIERISKWVSAGTRQVDASDAPVRDLIAKWRKRADSLGGYGAEIDSYADELEAARATRRGEGEVKVLTLVDGTEVREGDKVRAIGESGGWRVCTVLEILRGCGVDKAILTAGTVVRSGKLGSTFGTVIRTRYQIKPRRERQTRGGKLEGRE